MTSASRCLPTCKSCCFESQQPELFVRPVGFLAFSFAICTDFAVTIRCFCATQRFEFGAEATMSRRVKRPLAKSRAPGDRPKGARPYRNPSHAERPQAHRPGGKPARFSARRAEKPGSLVAEPEKIVPGPPPLSIKVQTVVVTADENNMRVDRFLVARFPGLSFSHIQRIVRKGELRVNGKRADSKVRLEEGQSIRIPPLNLDAPKVAGHLSEAANKTLLALRDMILYEDADVMVLNKPAGLAVQGGSGTTRHIDQMLEVMRDAKE